MADRGRRKCSPDAKTSRSDDKEGLGNKFANDGSFMEMFRRKMEEQKASKENEHTTESSESPTLATTTSPPPQSVAGASSSSLTVNTAAGPAETVIKSSKPLPFVGKRRGATPVLKTGAVKKAKKEQEEEVPKKDAWSQYLAEVKKYKEQSCQEENKTRPLVK